MHKNTKIENKQNTQNYNYLAYNIQMF